MVADKNNKKFDEIDAILAQDGSASVIDTLLSIPREIPTASDEGTWERALHARLQERLSRKMREILEESRNQSNSKGAA
ncbi:hypothetical protein [Chelativorans sp. Marseille-P2723]|uniref:hypothetical protein n=1 Tax=Chelativorans sp. Marseille-P2723 TaxID=2709133 RepID=UPI00156F930F|nr:hypothetical protein [Chelativorans sp. Marseille-P2723]